MDMRRIPEEERTPHAKSRGDAVMDAIRRKPVHRRDREPQLSNGTAFDISERQLAIAAWRSADGTDQTEVTRTFEGEDRQEISFVEFDMDFAIGREAISLHVGDVEHAGICSSREARPERLANDRRCAVTSSEIGRLADFL